MKVLHLIDSAGLYGAEQVVLGLSQGLMARGHRATIGSIRLPGEPPKAIEIEAERLGIEVWRVTARRGLDLAALRSAALQARQAGIDVIHCHGYKANIHMALVGPGAFAGPLVTTLHGWTATAARQARWWYSVVERQLLRRFSAVVGVHAGMASDARLPRSVRSQLTVIENGIDASPPAAGSVPNEALSSLREFCTRQPTIGVVGRLSPEKGVDVLLQAFALARENASAAQLAIIGDGPMREQLRQQADQLGISPSVHFSGFVPSAASIIPMLALLAIPSHSEGLPVVMLEALRARTPIVATRVGGIPSALEEGRAGRLVPPGNAAALAEAIQLVLNDPSLAASYREAGFLRFSERFNQDVMVTRYLQLYTQRLGLPAMGLAA
jgi:glycosyltransferase involved in cell wall biosynthesis